MNKPLTAPLDPALADRLLDLLSTDDLFRARFQRDPRSALEEVGYVSPEPAQMTACGAVPFAQPEALIDCRVEDLAPKEAIAQARESIKAMLTEGLSQTSPQLDTATASRRLRS
jgi:putative modified peptide